MNKCLRIFFYTRSQYGDILYYTVVGGYSMLLNTDGQLIMVRITESPPNLKLPEHQLSFIVINIIQDGVLRCVG